MKEGSVKILSSVYEFLEEGSQHGEAVVGNYESLYCKKLMEAGSMEMEISNLIAVRGRTVIEISAMEDGEAASIEQLVFIANLLLDPDVASDMLAEINTRRLRESAGLGSFISLPDSASAKRDDRSSYYFRPAINIRQDGSIWTNFAQFSGDGAPKHVMTPEDGQFEDDWLFDPQAPDEYKMIREWLSDITSVMSKMTQEGSPTEQDDREGIPVDPLLINADALSPFRPIETVMYSCRYKGIELWRVQLGLSKGKKLNLFSNCDWSDSLRAFDGFIRGYVGDGMPSYLLAEDWMPGDDEERVVVRLSVVEEGSRLSESGERSFDPKLDDRFIYDDTRELNYQVGEKEYDAARRVRSRLKSLLRKNEDLYVVIQSGPKVATQEVIEVYEALLDAEVTKIYFAASEEE